MAKIKRYKNIYLYRRRKRNVLKPILFCLGAAVLIFVGYSVAGAAVRFFKGEAVARSSSETGSSKAAASSRKSVSSQPALSAADAASAVKGLYLPYSYLSNTAGLTSTTAAAKSAGLNLVVVDVKDEDGLVHYQSVLPAVTTGGLVAANSPDAAVASGIIKKAGLAAGARMTCFIDAAGSNVMRDAAALYGASGTTRWMDQQNRFWLNPYSSKAQQYVIDLAKELVSKGYTYIVLDSVSFPPASSGAYFAGASGTRENALAAFVQNARKQIDAAGGKLIVHFDASTAIGVADATTGLDQDMYALGADYVSPDFCPSSLATAVTVGTTALTKPDLNPAATVLTLSKFAATKMASGGAKLMPYLQAYTNTGLGGGNYKTYAASDISGEIVSLNQAGYGSYILYSPTGAYSLSGVQTK